MVDIARRSQHLHEKDKKKKIVANQSYIGGEEAGRRGKREFGMLCKGEIYKC